MESIDLNIFKVPIIWETEKPCHLSAKVDNKKITLIIHTDFPFEDLYTLEMDNKSLNFNIWPENWEMG